VNSLPGAASKESRAESMYARLGCYDLRRMMKKRVAFALFSAAILFSMVREWAAPVACKRRVPVPSVVTQTRP
jgi:hypothetical protein